MKLLAEHAVSMSALFRLGGRDKMASRERQRAQVRRYKLIDGGDVLPTLRFDLKAPPSGPDEGPQPGDRRRRDPRMSTRPSLDKFQFEP
ncbi:unnamed protein product [Lota lota]